MKFTNFKISRESIFPIDNVAHVRSRKTFYYISVHFRNPGFCSVSKLRKPFFIFTTGPTTTGFQVFSRSTTTILRIYFKARPPLPPLLAIHSSHKILCHMILT